MATIVSRPAKARIDGSYFTGMSVVILGIVLLGFARTYYLAGMVHAPLPSEVIHIHAVVFSSWILLLIAQALLVTAGRVDWHRSLGVLGTVAALLVLVLGVAAAIDVQRRHAPPPPGLTSPQIFAIQVVLLAVFALLVAGGIGARRDAPAHKRLMLLSTIALMGPAISRWPFAVIADFPPSAGFVSDALMLSLFAFDWQTRRRIHRVTVWGSLLVFAIVPAGFALSSLPIWLRFTEWVRQ